MPESQSLQTTDSDQKKQGQDIASSLMGNGPLQVGGMVTIVILVGQAFARYNQEVVPYVAFLFSLLLATYQLRLVQKATVQQCVITVPIAAAILFSLALGGNNSIDQSSEMTSDNSSLKAELLNVKEQLKLRDQDLRNAKEAMENLKNVLDVPQKSAGVHPINSDRANFSQEKSGQARCTNWWLAAFTSEAFADTPSQEEERKRALDALREYESKSQLLQLQQQQLRLEQLRIEQERQEKEKNQSEQSKALWRKW